MNGFPLKTEIVLPDGRKATVSTINRSMTGHHLLAETMIFPHKEDGYWDSAWGEERHADYGETPPSDELLRKRHAEICADPQAISYYGVS